MPDLYPIEERTWITGQLYKNQLRQMYGKSYLRLVFLPPDNIWPEHFLKLKTMDVEVMVACLKAGAWLGAEDWQPYVRYTIAKRLRIRSKVLFTPPFDEIRGKLLDYQLNGGTFKAQSELKKYVAAVMKHPKATKQQEAMCRLMMAIIDPIEDNTLFQPFHWIRAALAATETSPVYSMTLYTSEMQKQKVTLCQMLRATLPS